MNALHTLFFTIRGWLILGVILGAGGAFALWCAYEKVPERAELIAVNGTAREVMRVARKKYGVETSVKYEVHFVTSANKEMTFSIPDDILTEDQAGSLSGQPLTVLLSDADSTDVWELRRGNRTIIDYPKARDAKVELHYGQTIMAAVALPASILLLLAALFRHRRGSVAA
jgi:hypothetical protein